MTSQTPRVELTIGPSRAVSGVVACVDARGVTVGRAALRRDGGLEVTGSERVNFDDGASALDPEALADVLAHAVSTAGLGRRVTALALVDDLFGASLGSWQDDLERDAEEVLVARRVREIVETSAVPLTAARCPAGADGDGRPQAFFTWATEPFTRAFGRALAARRLVVEQVVPRSIALLGLFAATRAGRDETGLVAGVGDRHLVIGAYHADRPVYVRFLRQVLPEGDDAEARHHAAVSEVRRTIAFFKENHRGRGIDTVRVYGDDAASLAGLVPTVLGVDDSAEFAPGWSDDETMLAALVALRARAGRRFSLLPEPRSRKRRAVVAAAVVGLAAWSAQLVSIERDVVSAAEKTVSDLNELVDAEGRGWADVARELDALRRRAVDVRTLGAAGLVGADPAAVLLDAVARLPDDVELRELTVDDRYGDAPGARALHLTLVTRADAVGSVDAYVDALRARRWCLAAFATDDRADLAARRRLQDGAEPVTATLEVALR